MIPVVYPRSINWFYQAQALSLAEDLCAVGVPARAVASEQPWLLADCSPEIALVVSYAETLTAAERAGIDAPFRQAMARFHRRVLLNFDSIQSRWFDKHFVEGPGYFAEILDVGLYRQTAQAEVSGVPFRFVPEAFSAAERARIRPWAPGRSIPWTMLGHATTDRSALVEAALRCLPKNGFVFSPPLRPFTEKSGLNREAIDRVLGQTDFYIWGSHHQHPYHETQRALHAVAAGAIPAKIDPLHSARFAIPWVYPSLNALLEQRDRQGLDALYGAARRFLEQQGTIGQNVKAALGLDPAAPLPRTEVARP